MKWTSKLEEMFRRRHVGAEVEEKVKRVEENHIQPLPIDFNLRILVVTDGHGCLAESDIPPYRDIDVCLLLGDLSIRDIAIVKEKIGNIPVYGVLGNHDGFELYDRFGIENIHGKVVEIDGVRIAGMQGAFRYKDTNFPFYTDDESVEIAEEMDGADILISHDYPKDFHKNTDWAHSGLQGITHYCEKHRVPLNIHGHFHNNLSGVLENGTRTICCYRATIIDTSAL